MHIFIQNNTNYTIDKNCYVETYSIFVSKLISFIDVFLYNDFTKISNKVKKNLSQIKKRI